MCCVTYIIEINIIIIVNYLNIEYIQSVLLFHFCKW